MHVKYCYGKTSARRRKGMMRAFNGYRVETEVLSDPISTISAARVRRKVGTIVLLASADVPEAYGPESNHASKITAFGVVSFPTVVHRGEW